MLTLGIGFLLVMSALNHLGVMENASTTKMMDGLLQTSCTGDIYQRQLDYIASSLKVEFLVRDETSVKLRLSNPGPEDILNCNWEMYFSTIVIPLKPNYTSKAFNMSHVNGFLFRLSSKLPSDVSVLLPRGGDEVISIDGHMPTKYFAFPDWFIVGSNASLRILSSTTVANQPSMVTINETYASKDRFDYNKNLTDDWGAMKPSPEPKSVIPTVFRQSVLTPTPEYVDLSGDWSIGYDSVNLTFEASLLEDFLGLKKNHTSEPTAKMIFLQLGPLNDDVVLKLPQEALTSPEAYKLVVNNDSVLLQAPTPAGAFYGVQTLMALCRNNKSTDSLKRTPVVRIIDFPRYKYRGLMIDVARHFRTVDTLKKLITVISTYKMNRLHIHLSDDEGWRIEVPLLPELTSVGARPTAKFGSRQKFDFLNAYVGAIPTDNSTANVTRQFYTREEYRSILQHAALHHVTVIPEVDFPGHSHAALVSMRARKRRLRLEGDPNAEAFDLEDEDDVSDDASVNNVADTVINTCRNSTIDFMRVIMVRLLQLHEDDQPLDVVHLGGDEVSHTALSESPLCKKLLGPGLANVSLYALGKLLALGEEFNKTIILWETNNRDLHSGEASKPIVHFWQPSTERDKVLADYVNAGMKVILSEADILYLDHPSEPSTLENGLRWATPKITEFDIFKYTPPKVCSQDDRDDDDCKKKMERVLGMQANLWGELIWKEEMVDEMLFPRLLAVAERAWHRPEWEEGDGGKNDLHRDWLTFASALVQRELSVLDGLSVKYRIPPPGARRNSEGTIEYNTILPGLQVLMSTDGGNTWKKPDNTRGDVLLATLSADGKRKSRFIPVEGLPDKPSDNTLRTTLSTTLGSLSTTSHTTRGSTQGATTIKKAASGFGPILHSYLLWLFCIVLFV